MLFQRNWKMNDKEPLSNFEAEIESDTKQLEGQTKKVVAYIKKKRVPQISRIGPNFSLMT